MSLTTTPINQKYAPDDPRFDVWLQQMVDETESKPSDQTTPRQTITREEPATVAELLRKATAPFKVSGW